MWDQVILSVVRCEEERDCAHSAQATEGPSSHTSRACAHRARARAQSKLENLTHHSQCTPSTQSVPHKRVPAPTQQSMRAQSACARTVQTRESHPPLTVHPLHPEPTSQEGPSTHTAEHARTERMGDLARATARATSVIRRSTKTTPMKRTTP